MKKLTTPFSEEDIAGVEVGDMVYISGYIYCGRDAVSPAGVGPTSSNKVELEGSMLPLSKNVGIKMHLGKGKLKDETIKGLAELNAVYAIIPPVTALLGSKTSDIQCVAHPELGMEALYRVKVDDYPVIIAGAKGRSIYDEL